MVEGNTDGDNLALTDSSGFCCRDTFYGGKTVTGTLYIGDLTIRANGVATATPSTSPVPPTAPVGTGFSGSTLAGGIIGGSIAGGASVVEAQVLQSRLKISGVGGVMAASTAETRGLLAASRLSSMKGHYNG